MDDAVFDKVISGLYDIGGKYDILLGTGESLLELDRVHAIIEWTNRNDKVITILTAGMPLVDRAIPVLRNARNLVLQVTFDGMTQEDLSGVQRTNIEIVKVKAKKAANLLNVQFNYTLHTKSIDSVMELLDFAHECRVERVFLTPIQVYDVCEDVQEISIGMTDESVKGKLAAYMEHAKALGLKLKIPDVRTPSPSVGYGELFSLCSKGQYLRPIIRVDGGVAVCWGREDVLIGDLRTQSFAECIGTAPYEAIRVMQEQGMVSELCHGCNVLRDLRSDIYRVPMRDPSYSVHSLLQSVSAALTGGPPLASTAQ
jgi:MoaA/NifB/PqqE/SkfB family radical SAM enzyme